jgi:hypothetical protein
MMNQALEFSCFYLSDRSAKDNIALIYPQAVLQSVTELPISTWNYTAQGDAIRHIGPTAQDFYAAFGVGEDNRHISTIDADGVALAAIQGLHEIVREKDAQINDLQQRVDDLEARLSSLEAIMQPQEAGFPTLAVLLTALIFGGLWLGKRS